MTERDYRWCDLHLKKYHRLIVQKSKICDAGVGLFAAGDFKRGEIIGTFGGEIINNAEYERRYSSSGGFAPYVLGLCDDASHDETWARTALSYANDGVDLEDHLMRRNYVFKTGTHVVWHNLEWPHVINAVCDLTPDKTRACLIALWHIRSGDEILFSYSGSNAPSKDENGEWVAEPHHPTRPIDSYFYGYFMTRAETDRGSRDQKAHRERCSAAVSAGDIVPKRTNRPPTTQRRRRSL